MQLSDMCFVVKEGMNVKANQIDLKLKALPRYVHLIVLIVFLQVCSIVLVNQLI